MLTIWILHPLPHLQSRLMAGKYKNILGSYILKEAFGIFCILKHSRESLKITKSRVFRIEKDIIDDLTQWFSNFAEY